MGGSAAINVTRPYIESIVVDQLNRRVHNFDAIVRLYPGCVDRNTIERFKKVPMLILVGEKDDQGPPALCEKQAEWMNRRGASVEIQVVPGAYHDWDAPYGLRMAKYENTSKCGNTCTGDKFVLDSNGKEYPGTPEGFKAMREDCSYRGHMTGNQGNPKLGYEIWTAYLSKHLLH
jgi:dienelactone hydrolase